MINERRRHKKVTASKGRRRRDTHFIHFSLSFLCFPTLTPFPRRSREGDKMCSAGERERVEAFYINGPIQRVHWPCNLEKKCVFVLRISILELTLDIRKNKSSAES